MNIFKSSFSLLLFLLYTGLLIFFSSCQKEPLVKIHTPEELDASLQKSYGKSRFGGFSVSVIKNGRIAFQESYGKANFEKNIDLTNQTAMNIASISKLFIGVALVKAIEQGHFTLETKVNDILPFPVINPNSPETPIQVKHLVTHTSGILDNQATYFSNYSILEGEDLTTSTAQRMINELGVKTNGEVLALGEFMQAYLTPDGSLYNSANFSESAAGTSYSYGNIASALAAYLIEVKTGESFEEYTQSVIFTPLEMNNTAWKVEKLDRNAVSLQYWDRDNPLPYYTQACYPDGMLMTSVNDLSNFMLEMIKAKAGHSDLLLSKEGYKLLFERKLHPKPAAMPAKEDNYGVFWIWSTSGRLGHTGGEIGTFALFGFDPEANSGSILLINSNVEEINKGASLELVKEIITAYKSFEEGDKG